MDNETHKAQMAKLKAAQRQIENLTQQGLAAIDREITQPLRDDLKRIEAAREEQEQQIFDDGKDPLRNPVEVVDNHEFEPSGAIKMDTLRRRIAQWRDDQGHEFYTEEPYLPLPQIRARRNNVVAQESVWGGLE